MNMKDRNSGILRDRIASGEAEPISDFEKKLANQIISKYEAKYGLKKTDQDKKREEGRVVRRSA
ncbi:hypothetical protein [Glutamicibacter sp.]|uniref:hypothetical protein n=1 Tax=Glutamicibacter sp. TaxID=1931995 RepID=UPI002FD98FF5